MGKEVGTGYLRNSFEGGADGAADNGHFMPAWAMRSQINRYPESSDR